uniref:ECSIT C-terminal domain-containing protein n=1 Tax=Strigamia maritima TaxID=126957 RepID=T1IHW6_STRMM
MINYFILRADAKPAPTFITKEELDDVSDIPVFWGTEEPKPAGLCVIPSVHEQDDGTILAMCATGTSSRDSVLSWIRFLQNENPRLAKIPILLKLRAPSTDLVIKEDKDAESKPKWKPAVNQDPEWITFNGIRVRIQDGRQHGTHDDQDQAFGPDNCLSLDFVFSRLSV